MILGDHPRAIGDSKPMQAAPSRRDGSGRDATGRGVAPARFIWLGLKPLLLHDVNHHRRPQTPIGRLGHKCCLAGTIVC